MALAGNGWGAPRRTSVPPASAVCRGLPR